MRNSLRRHGEASAARCARASCSTSCADGHEVLVAASARRPPPTSPPPAAAGSRRSTEFSLQYADGALLRARTLAHAPRDARVPRAQPHTATRTSSLRAGGMRDGLRLVRPRLGAAPPRPRRQPRPPRCHHPLRARPRGAPLPPAGSRSRRRSSAPSCQAAGATSPARSTSPTSTRVCARHGGDGARAPAEVLPLAPSTGEHVLVYQTSPRARGSRTMPGLPRDDLRGVRPRPRRTRATCTSARSTRGASSMISRRRAPSSPTAGTRSWPGAAPRQTAALRPGSPPGRAGNRRISSTSGTACRAAPRRALASPRVNAPDARVPATGNADRAPPPRRAHGRRPDEPPAPPCSTTHRFPSPSGGRTSWPSRPGHAARPAATTLMLACVARASARRLRWFALAPLVDYAIAQGSHRVVEGNRTQPWRDTPRHLRPSSGCGATAHRAHGARGRARRGRAARPRRPRLKRRASTSVLRGGIRRRAGSLGASRRGASPAPSTAVLRDGVRSPPLSTAVLRDGVRSPLLEHRGILEGYQRGVPRSGRPRAKSRGQRSVGAALKAAAPYPRETESPGCYSLRPHGQRPSHPLRGWRAALESAGARRARALVPGSSPSPPSPASTSCSSVRPAPAVRGRPARLGRRARCFQNTSSAASPGPARSSAPSTSASSVRAWWRSRPRGCSPRPTPFLDEVFLGSTAILNTPPASLNERSFRTHCRRVPLTCASAPNAFDDDAPRRLRADRFVRHFPRRGARRAPRSMLSPARMVARRDPQPAPRSPDASTPSPAPRDPTRPRPPSHLAPSPSACLLKNLCLPSPTAAPPRPTPRRRRRRLAPRPLRPTSGPHAAVPTRGADHRAHCLRDLPRPQRQPRPHRRRRGERRRSPRPRLTHRPARRTSLRQEPRDGSNTGPRPAGPDAREAWRLALEGFSARSTRASRRARSRPSSSPLRATRPARSSTQTTMRG